MRLLISGVETCGIIHDLAEEFRRRGHSVSTVAMPDPFFPFKYDYDQYDFPVSFLSRRFGAQWFWRRCFQTLWELNPRWHESIELRLRRALVRDVDLYVRVWGNIPFDREILESLGGRIPKVATFFMGSDVRDYNVFQQHYAIERWAYPAEYHAVSTREKLQILRTHERYADAIFSVPDQMGLALRPYHHLQVPLRLEEFSYEVPARAVPRVVHAPSIPHVKGTDVIEDALNTLRNEGIEFEHVSVRQIPHDMVLRILTDADVLVDELVAHGPGWLSFEAMASGCAVATRYLEDSPVCFRPPVWRIDEHDIVDRLRTLLTDGALRVKLAEQGRRYVEEHNPVERVVDAFLEKVELGRSAPTDYVPTFLATRYVPKSEEEARMINAGNALVSGEEWYRIHVAGHAHDGLVF